MSDDVALLLVNALADQTRREESATALARHFGAEALIALVPDPELGALRPAPGFRQTLPGGPTWARLLAKCRQPGEQRDAVAFPTRDRIAVASAWTGDDRCTFVFLGGAPRLTAAAFAHLPFRVIAALFQAECAASAAAAQIEVSHDATRHANELARALDHARAETLTKAAELETALAEAARLNNELHDLNATLERHAEERAAQLVASRARLRAFFDNSPDWLTLQRATRDGRFVYEDLNPACERGYGFSREQVIGKTVSEVLGPEAAQTPLRHFRELMRTGRPQRYLTKRTMAGASYTIDVMFALVPGEVDGERFIITTARDVTDRELLQEQLRQAQKMEAIGQLTGGVAHDFNNLLAAILGNLELLDRHVGEGWPRQMLLSAIRSVERGAKLNEQLLAFSRKQHLRPSAVDLNRSIGAMTDLLARTIGVGIGIRTALAPDLWPALVDPNQIELVILNLAINARDAMPGGGTLTLSTQAIPAEAVDPGLDLQRRDYVRLAVADTGSGMSDEVRERAFDPFFTTKAAGQGTGLGLSQVYGIARQSRGTVRIQSRVGEGTTVEIYLPRADAPATAVETETPTAAPRAARTRTIVLVIDDQDDVREVTIAHLQALGYETLDAPNGRAGLDILAKRPDVDALLVDFAMPGMSGLEVMRTAHARRPDLPVLLLTGYADTTLGEADLDQRLVLRKPFKMHDLAARVAAMTDRAASPSSAPAL